MLLPCRNCNCLPELVHKEVGFGLESIAFLFHYQCPKCGIKSTPALSDEFSSPRDMHEFLIRSWNGLVR